MYQVLAIAYDAGTEMLYVAGSTHRDLCRPPPAEAADGCTVSDRNRAMAAGGTA